MLLIQIFLLLKICKVDQQMMGTMPAYVTTLLTVFYLQQLSPPVLPVLHEYSNPPDSSSVVSSINNIHATVNCSAENSTKLG